MKEYRVFGIPGAGKTTHLAKLIVEAVKVYGADAVYVSSFTRAAASELVGRSLPITRDHVGTLHSMALRLLDIPNIKVAGGAIRKEDLKRGQQPWVNLWNARPIAAMFPMHAVSGGADEILGGEIMRMAEGDRYMRKYTELRGRMVDLEAWALQAGDPDMLKFRDEWEQFKREENMLDFTDMIERCVMLPAYLPAQSFFVDEAQDLSPLELTLVRLWGSQAEQFVMAGDDEQCIYTFKGAESRAFLEPDIPAEQKTILAKSWRCPQGVLDLAQRLMTRCLLKREPKTYEGRCSGGILTLNAYGYDEVQYLYEDLCALVKEDQKTVAILASCSYMLKPVVKVLKIASIPYWNPYRKENRSWNPLGKWGKVSPLERIEAFLKPSETKAWWTYGELWAWAKWIGVKPLYNDDGDFLGNEKTWARGSKAEIERMGTNEETQDKPVDEAMLQKWLPSAEAAEAALTGNLVWYGERLMNSAPDGVQFSIKVAIHWGIDLLRKPPRIIVGTIHSVKGGEADVVYLYPDISNAAKEAIEAAHNPEATEHDREAHDSVYRTFYVGITRAKEALHVCRAVNDDLTIMEPELWTGKT